MSRRARAALVAGIAAAAIALTPVSPAAAAVPLCPLNHACMYDFFDSPAYDTRVGYQYIHCDGTTNSHGQKTPWVVMDVIPC